MLSRVGYLSGRAWSSSSKAWSFWDKFGSNLQQCHEAMRMGSQSSILEVPMHILDFWVRVIPHQQSPILEFNGRLTWDQPGKTKSCARFRFLWNLKIWSHGGRRSLTRLLRTRETQSLYIYIYILYIYIFICYILYIYIYIYICIPIFI